MWRILVNLKRELAELLFGSYVRKGGCGRGRLGWMMAPRERRDVTRVVLNSVESTTRGERKRQVWGKSWHVGRAQMSLLFCRSCSSSATPTDLTPSLMSWIQGYLFLYIKKLLNITMDSLYLIRKTLFEIQFQHNLRWYY